MYNDIERTESVVYEEATHERLDVFLFKKFPEYSRTYFQNLIVRGLVTVNDKVANKSLVLKFQDKIKISFPVPPSISGQPVETPFEVLDTQEHFLIINKPAGLTVHRSAEKIDEPTLVNGLLYRFQEFKEFGDLDRPGIVHRLDKGTSGLLIVARNVPAQIEFSRLFKHRLVKKTYLAVVKGHPDASGTIDLPIGRHRVERNKMSHLSYDARPALTHYKVVKYFKDCSLVEVNIITGRTHQIRVHFAARGHGLLGDSVYGLETKLMNRQALHSWKVEFDFRGKHYEYTCSGPKDFEFLVQQLEEIER